MTIQHFAYSTSPNKDIGVLVATTFAPLTLRGCSVEAEVRGNCARVNVRYEYDNHTGKDQRVIAAYPLPVAWDLMSCRADYFGDSVLTEYAGTVPLRSSAEAGAAGLPGPKSDHTVWTVASQQLPWVVGIGSTVLVAATYHVPLDATRWHGVVRIHLPAELFPETKAPPPTTLEYAALFDMRVPAKLPRGWSIHAKCDMFVPLAGAVRVRPVEKEPQAQVEYIGDSGFTLNYAAPLTTRMRDGFEVEYAVQGTAEPLRFFLAKDVGARVQDVDRYALTLLFTPQLEGRQGCVTNAELVLVVDAHSHPSCEAMAHGLLVGLRGLPDSVFLNLVVVGAARDVCPWQRGAVPLREVQFDQLAAFVAGAKPQEAKTGASHLHRTLREVMAQEPLSLCGPVPVGYVRHVIVLSDEGDSQYATEIIEAATRHRRNMCFSAVGLLSAGTLDAPPLRLLAEEGGGLYRDAADAAELPEALVEILSHLAVPTLTDIAMRFEEPEVRLSAGKTLPAVAQGTQRFVHGLAPASLETLGVCATGRVGATVVEYVGKGNVQDLIFTSEAEPRNALSIGLFHLAAAAARERHLVDARELSALTQAEMEEVARLSATFLLPSPYTEMVQLRPAASAAAAAQAQSPRSAVAVRYVPRSWTYARKMRQYRRQRLADGLIDGRPTPLRRAAQQQQQLGVSQASGASAALAPPPTSRDFIRAIVAGVAEAVIAGPSLERLTALQAIDGSFPLNSLLGISVGVSLDRLEREFSLAGFGVSEDLTAGMEYLRSHERFWATAIAAAAMELRPFATTAVAYRSALSFLSSKDAKGELLRHAREVIKRPPSLHA
ncbi:uncharacterized protein Tco025E_00802 [Trypanosoma conorhini]|uniref:VWFA domain-containing protein n=1 Tax=Trypanosoma conorhini TaxID=83891 RepID=A0A3R7P0N7_9TRYP|nr:uncharacterized protein Tco025E_00802 [Trypanosoma conorhini]RNF26936.1 hypothetical protein Tco025E_00802 [Trypanosoma conorhini]